MSNGDSVDASIQLLQLQCIIDAQKREMDLLRQQFSNGDDMQRPSVHPHSQHSGFKVDVSRLTALSGAARDAAGSEQAAAAQSSPEMTTGTSQQAHPAAAAPLSSALSECRSMCDQAVAIMLRLQRAQQDLEARFSGNTSGTCNTSGTNHAISTSGAVATTSTAALLPMEHTQQQGGQPIDPMPVLQQQQQFSQREDMLHQQEAQLLQQVQQRMQQLPPVPQPSQHSPAMTAAAAATTALQLQPQGGILDFSASQCQYWLQLYGSTAPPPPDATAGVESVASPPPPPQRHDSSPPAAPSGPSPVGTPSLTRFSHQFFEHSLTPAAAGANAAATAATAAAAASAAEGSGGGSSAPQSSSCHPADVIPLGPTDNTSSRPMPDPLPSCTWTPDPSRIANSQMQLSPLLLLQQRLLQQQQELLQQHQQLQQQPKQQLQQLQQQQQEQQQLQQKGSSACSTAAAGVVEVNVSGTIVHINTAALTYFPDSSLCHALVPGSGPMPQWAATDGVGRAFLPFRPAPFLAVVDALHEQLVFGGTLDRPRVDDRWYMRSLLEALRLPLNLLPSQEEAPHSNTYRYA